MITASLSISLGGSVLLAIFLLILFIGLAFAFYRFTLPPLPPGKRIALSALRAVSLSLLLLLFFEPLLRFIRHDDQQPVVTVLVDNSQSLTVSDNNGNRTDAVKKLLASNYIGSLPSGTAVRYNIFSSSLHSVESSKTDSIQFNGEATNISNAFSEIKEKMNKENIQSVVLISDGNYTVGKNPLYDAEALGLPVYTIGVGDTTEQKDILVEKILTNNLAYAETRVPVDVTIKSSGFNYEKVEVTVAEGSAVLDRKMITLQEGTKEYAATLFVEPKEEGTKKYTVSVSKLPGELTEKNNTRQIFMKILKSKLRVLILAGAPNPDVSAVRQALTEDQHITVTSRVQKSPGEFYEGQLSQAIADSADCLVLIGFPSSASSPAVLQQLKDIIEQKKKPLLFINSKTTDYTKLQQLSSVLPFDWSGLSNSEVNVFPAVIEKQKMNPLINLEGMITADSWNELPPVFKTQTIFHAKAESDVLAMVKIQNVVINEPLVITRNVNRQKSFAITGHGIWRWRLLAQGNTQTEQFLPLLISNAVRWLTTKEEGKNVRVTPVKEIFTTDEPVEFTAQVYDDQLHPVDNAELKVELQKGKETFQVDMTAIGSGRYEGAVENAAGGDYTFTGKATIDGASLGEDKGRFSVGETNAEFLETRMNKELLEQIAFRTGGKYYDVKNASGLSDDLSSAVKLTPKEIIQTSEIELWNWQYIAAILVLLFGIEWFLRKRSGML